jgi:peptidoglycan/xylan/chitin deacetylase (PgdA/CDA1 family)
MDKYYLEQASRFLSPPLYYSQLHQLTRPFYSGLGQILMFHRVVPESDSLRIHNHKSLEVTPEYLEQLILFFRKMDYQFVSLDELNVQAKADTPKKKFVVFTFDDGYVDNYTYAYPVFKKYQVPFTIYVTTGLPDGEAVLWWYLLEELVASKTKIEFTVDNTPMVFLTDSIRKKEMAFNRIRTMFANAGRKKLDVLVASIFHQEPERIRAMTKALSLTWEQIIELSMDPLVTIGSHTVNHLPLDCIPYDQAMYEILESKRIIESRTNTSVRHFCYPLGSYGQKEIEIVGKCGYATATTIKMANIQKENLEYPYALPRIMINSLTSEYILRLQLNGLLPAIRNKFRRIVY